MDTAGIKLSTEIKNPIAEIKETVPPGPDRFLIRGSVKVLTAIQSNRNNIFVIPVFGEIVGMILIIIKYLFILVGREMIDFMKKL
ncbi:MAG: hypothetical protein ACM3X9_04495 [Bacillota bacterium]